MNIKECIKKISPTLYYKLAYLKMLFYMKNFTKNYPNTKKIYYLFDRKFKRKINSQYNQDYILEKTFFENVKKGFFCDVGGNHPININNTLHFEKKGWEGIAFDPLPDMKKLWQKNRTADFNQLAASDSTGKEIFTIVKNTTGWEDMLSFVKNTSNTNYNYETTDIEVDKIQLKNFFEKKKITNIDFMSIDVEGHELNVLKGIDFKNVNINVVLIENNFGGVGTSSFYGDDKIRKVMLENGYIFWGRIIGLDDIYVNKNFKY